MRNSGPSQSGSPIDPSPLFDFAIGTIDSFSHRIVRSFAREFGLPVNFNVELDRDELLTIPSICYEKVGDDAGLTNLW